jgi:hypothetical protein
MNMAPHPLYGHSAYTLIHLLVVMSGMVPTPWVSSDFSRRLAARAVLRFGVRVRHWILVRSFPVAATVDSTPQTGFVKTSNNSGSV